MTDHENQDKQSEVNAELRALKQVLVDRRKAAEFNERNRRLVYTLVSALMLAVGFIVFLLWRPHK